MGNKRHGLTWIDTLKMALHTITRNRTRSWLLILGVSIGVTTLLAIYTIVGGLSQRIRNDIVSANRPYIYITRNTGLGGEDPEKLMRRAQLGPDCIDALKETSGIEFVDYQVSNSSGMVLKYREEKTNFVQAFGSSENFPYLFSIKVGEGRFFTDAEVTARKRVCVLGFGPAKDLFPKRDPIGKVLRIFGKPYRIVGTMQERGHILGAMGENYVCLPWTIFEKDGLSEGVEDRNIAVSVHLDYDVEEAISNVVGSIRQVRRLRPGQENDFDVIASETYGEMVDKITGGIALLLVVLSSIGLLVGGIGVMNIMLISVAERTREIGLRMALGARRKEVLYQVLVEAGILTGVGGVLGVCLGYLASYGVTQVLRFPLTISPIVTVGAALFSISIGLFFGLYPANKAARMDPVVALGRE